MSFVDEVTHYHNLKSDWQVTHWRTKWEGIRQAVIKWTRINMRQGIPVSEWEWETITEQAAHATIKKEKLEPQKTKRYEFGPEPAKKTRKRRGRPKKDA